MKVALFHPPVGSVTQPCLSTPSLVAYLKQNGVNDIVQYDLNLHVAEVLLSSERLMRAYRWCYHYLNKFTGESTPSEIDFARMQLAFSTVVCGKPEAGAIERAKQVFRSSRFHDSTKYQEALDAIRSGYLLLSARHFPTVLSNESLSMRYRLDSSADFLAGAED